MHEMGIAMQIIEIAEEAIPENMKGVQIARLNLKIGKLSAVVPQSLRFCFEVAAKETALDGAELHIEEIPVRAVCKDCGHQWTIEGPAFSCPKCETGNIDIVSGRELDIVSLEVKE